MPWFKEQNKLGAAVVKRLGLQVSFLYRPTFCFWKLEWDCKIFKSVSDYHLLAQLCCFVH